MLTDWINDANITLVNQVNNWQSAVELAVQSLIAQQAVESRYLQAIYAMHEQIGPYYVLGEGIAMPHARPEEGVIKTALSLVLVKEGVNFGSEDNDPVYIIFGLSAVDSNSHIEMIASLSQFFCDEEAVKNLKLVINKQQVLDIIGQF
ncbi:PTS sugar transporter subunit IIA [Sodalis ligni]|uniref:PTS sugar transporter subunit IIA n=1 Tax=Sodalis ligni TaxID=2697027 RepID=UPI00193F6A24|nr:PTS sugar transporter subunit IIA [Sodalis ligni]QWA12030.1 PTS sugar transporter subunit IIA [Sodalis ligni]